MVLAGALLGLVVLTACGGGEEGPPADATAAGQAASAAADLAEAPDDGAVEQAGTATPVPVIGEVVWTTAVEPGTNAPLAPVDRFPIDAPAIRAVVAVAMVPPDSVLVGSWAYNDVPLEGLEVEVVVPARIDETVWVEFHLERGEREAWPEGSYAISLSLNGEPVRTSSVQVGDAEAR